VSAVTEDDRVAALAAMLVCCQGVDQLARTGVVPPGQLRSAMTALLSTDAGEALALYREPEALRAGLDLLEPLLRGERRADTTEVLRYAVGVLHLQRRLLRDGATRGRIYAGIERAAAQARLFSPTHDNVLANLAQCYQDTLGRYRFRIQVRGESGYLSQEAVAARVRCLLFAAIRAAVLWHQLGGRRWQLLLRRGPLLTRIRRLRSGS